MVSEVVLVTPPAVAVIVATVVAVTVLVVIGNAADCEPCGTVTLAGVDAAGWLLDSATGKPLSHTAIDKTTAPVALPPPVTVEGLVTRFVRIGEGGGVNMLSVVVFVTPLYLALIVTATLVVTGEVVMAKLADDAPCAIVALAGTDTTLGSLLVKDTNTLPGAGAFTATVPVDPLPPVTADGFAVTVARLKTGVVPGPSTGVSLATNASAQKTSGSPAQTLSGAPGVVGKSADIVWPVT
jgi:hypothetical protein